ncbi:MAG: hypothetical protein R3228_08095 [Halioglobus sp.]|nr:hypothetical protein [Halioglobus sp.]
MTPASLWQTEFTLTEQEYVDANLLFSRPTTGARKVFALAAIILLLIAILVDSELGRALSLGALLGGALGQLLARFVVAPWLPSSR